MGKVTKKLFCFVFFLLFIHSIFSLIKIGTTLAPDFSVYYYAASDVLLGENPYLDLSLYTSFSYPPFSLIFLMPFAFLPYSLSQWLWLILSYLAFFLSTFLSLRLSFEKVTPSLFYLTFSFAFLFFPIKFTLGMGQVNFLVFLVFVLAICLYEKNKDRWAGILLGLMVVMKFPSIFLFLFFLFKKEWRVLGYAFLTIFLLIVVSVALFGLPLHFFYFKNIIPQLLTFSGRGVYYNQGITGFISRLSFSETLTKFLTLTISALFLIATLFLTRRPFKKRKSIIAKLEISLFIVTMLLVATFSWQHHFVWLIFPFIVLFRAILLEWSLINLTFLILTYALIAGNIKNPGFFESSWEKLFLSHVFLGGVLLWLIISFNLFKGKNLSPNQHTSEVNKDTSEVMTSLGGGDKKR